MAKVLWPDQALDDIDEIIAYIRKSNPSAAETIGARLFALGESLADVPQRGRPASNGARGLVTLAPYALRYRIAGDTVVIVHVRHTRRRPLP